MKKTTKLFGLFAVAAMTVIGCAKEIDAPKEEVINEPQEKVVETHTVTISTGAPETKTVINEGVSSASFKWSADDASRFHIWENSVAGTGIALETNDEYATVKLTATFATKSASSYTYTAFLAKNVANDSDPQVPAAQTCTGTSYDPDADILVALPVTNEGAVLEKIDMRFGRPCVINKMTLKGLTAGETLTKVEINSDKALTGHYDIEGEEWTDESKRITLTTSQVVPAEGEVVVYFVTKPVDAATLTVTAITNAHVYDKIFTKTINFVLNQVTVFGVSGLSQYTKRDVLTLPLTEVTGSSYASFNSKSYSEDGHSSAVYAGTIAGGNDAIQLNANTSTSKRGIVSTTSGGSLKKVRVSWNTNSTDTRALTVYGNSTAYTTADLNNSFGTEIGSITKGSTVELSVASNYGYVMLKASNAIYLDEIVLFWGEDTRASSGLKWTADGSDGDAVTVADAIIETGDDDMPDAALYNPNGISLGEITFTSSDTDVATIGEHTGAITLVGEGDTEIHAVFAGNATYKSADVHYTLSVTNNRSACVTPSFSHDAGEVAADTEVTVSSNTVGATLYYTLDDSTPTRTSSSSTLVDGSGKPYVVITINAAMTIKAIAMKDDWNTSSLASASYTISGSTKLLNPTGITFSTLKQTTFTASWTAVTNASSYDWKLSTSSTAAGITVGNTVASGNTTSTTCTQSGLSLTTNTYYLYVMTKGNGTTYLDSDGFTDTAKEDAILIALDFTKTTQRPDDFPSGTRAALSATSYNVDGYSFEFYGDYDGRWTSYLIFGKEGAYVKLPTISGKKLKNVSFSTPGTVSTNVVPKIMSEDGSSTVYDNKTKMATNKSYSWDLTGTTAGTRYRYQVSNAYNMQLATLVLSYLK